MMMNSFRLSILLIVMLLISGAAIGQRKEISQEEFDKVKTFANDMLSKKPYRITTTYERYVGAESTPSEITYWVSEFVAPDREHEFSGLKTQKGKATFERITIGGRKFEKKAGEDWREIQVSKGLSFGLSTGPNGMKYFSNGTEVINGKKANIYGYESSHKVYLYGREQISTYTATYWISKDGHFLKFVGENDGIGSQRSRETGIYTYDSKIKVDIPIK